MKLENPKSKFKDLIPAVLYVVLTAFSTVLMRYLSLRFKTAEINAWRFLWGFIGLFIILLIRKKGSELITALKSRKFIINSLMISLFIVGNMYFYIKGMALSDAASSSFVNLAGLPVTILMAALAFVDERKILRSYILWIGIMLILTGTYIFIISSGTHITRHFYLKAWIYFGIVIIIRGFQNISVKNSSSNVSVNTTGVFTVLWACIIFFLISWLSKEGAGLSSHCIEDISLLFFSGLLGLITGVGIGFFIIKFNGIIVFNIVSITTPVVTAVFGYIFLNENFNTLRWISAGIILIGSYIAIYHRTKLNTSN
ncbi:MAG: DMT family transporter [Spirochaetales bacterium]|nr:DMT family transporter [Spirochaetales bacterium]